MGYSPRGPQPVPLPHRYRLIGRVPNEYLPRKATLVKKLKELKRGDDLHISNVRIFHPERNSTPRVSLFVSASSGVVYGLHLSIMRELNSSESPMWFSLVEISPCCGRVGGVPIGSVNTQPEVDGINLGRHSSCCNRAYYLPTSTFNAHEAYESKFLVREELYLTPGCMKDLTNNLSERFDYAAQDPFQAYLSAQNVTAGVRAVMEFLGAEYDPNSTLRSPKIHFYTGATGSGKSIGMGNLINKINSHRGPTPPAGPIVGSTAFSKPVYMSPPQPKSGP